MMCKPILHAIRSGCCQWSIPTYSTGRAFIKPSQQSVASLFQRLHSKDCGSSFGLSE